MQPDTVLLLRLAYVAAAALVLVVFAIPALRSRFLAYGPRANPSTVEMKSGTNHDKRGDTPDVLDLVLDRTARICVPHSWFTSFYAVSVFCSLYWAPELLLKGPAFRVVSEMVPERAHSMTFRQVIIVWTMMFVQGSRRLYECMAVSAPSQSKMWVGHWAIGMFFYIATSLAVWLEGIASIQSHGFSLQDLRLDAPSIRTFIGLVLFMLASGLQHDCHAYLASLKQPRKDGLSAEQGGYKLPEHPAFNISLTPHYLAECVIYLSLAIVAAPRGDWLNWTFSSALLFVVINLGVTAHGTKEWYEGKFGPEKVKGTARMIPCVF